ncbi:IS6 family transposase [Candidatus Bathyarchaeota archaeon]|nr:IS6 family transposase [Candidatus Bathyarchaeota archaeon]
MMIETPRQERGLTIAKMPSQIKRINAHTYVVKSQSNNGEYRVSGNADEWICECPDNKYRHVECKHIYATKFSQSLRAEVAVRRIAPIENLSNCIYCGSSNLKKKGIRKNKSGNIQKFYCRDCHKYFTFNIGFERMKHNPQAITSAMQLYFTGESLRNVQKFLKLQGVSVSHVSVLKWIRKYVKLMNEYLEKIKPNVSDIWRADELYVKIKGDLKYLFAVMDDETRFWIAQEVAQTKDRHDARKLLQIAKQVTGKKPMTFITDGLPAYHDAYKKEFWTLKGPRTEHIQHITLKGDRNNNKMERMNGEVRDREKVLRGLKKEDSAILSGYQLFHNYVRPHESLDGKTPSEACGIKVEGQDKWKTLIENASKSKN